MTGRLTLLPLAVVVKLRRGANGRILSLDYTQDGKQVRQETPLLFLAAGAVQVEGEFQRGDAVRAKLAELARNVERDFAKIRLQLLFSAVTGAGDDRTRRTRCRAGQSHRSARR